jgi:hypothetical protein
MTEIRRGSRRHDGQLQQHDAQMTRVCLISCGTEVARPPRMTAKICIAALFLVAVPVGGSETLKMSVWPRMAVQPAAIVVRVSVEPDADNRAIAVSAESSDYFRSSQVQLDGTSASRTSEFLYRDLPAGSYIVRSTLIGANGHPRATAERRMIVNQ